MTKEERTKIWQEWFDSSPWSLTPKVEPALGPRRQGSEDKAKLIYKKFQPTIDHTKGPTGPELPFIYVPEHDTVYLGPPGAYHHDLIASSKALNSLYDPENAWKMPPAFTAEGMNHIHGRMTWPEKDLHILTGLTDGTKDLIPRIAEALDAKVPTNLDEQPQFA